ncbi:MAG: GNAT family N-acetyltransferase [Chloracidobacterium sp.]|nr:GNAT family N-acetyltransferase [Chloracidobacterium sp.]
MDHCSDTHAQSADLRQSDFNLGNRRGQCARQYCEQISDLTFPNLSDAGIQDKSDVALIRHAYVRTKRRKNGVGSLLLENLIKDAKKPILIGTWRAADWAISFYERRGFRLVEGEEEKNRLLKKYWSIPDRQVETSVVLVDEKYRESQPS